MTTLDLTAGFATAAPTMTNAWQTTELAITVGSFGHASTFARCGAGISTGDYSLGLYLF